MSSYQHIEERYLQSKKAFQKNLLSYVFLYYKMDMTTTDIKAMQLCCLCQLLYQLENKKALFNPAIEISNYKDYLSEIATHNQKYNLKEPSAKLFYDPSKMAILKIVKTSFSKYTEFELATLLSIKNSSQSTD